MSFSYPGSELRVEQLVHALVQTLSSNTPSRRELLKLGSHKIFGIERDLLGILQATRAIRNTYVPANQLPPEILSRVLEHRARERDLVSATQVCRYWRSTLISAPYLWNCLKFEYDIDRMLTYLERSKSALIDVSLSAGFWPEARAFGCLAPHIARVKSLVICGPRGIAAASFFLRNIRTPSLQHLEMTSSGDLIRVPDEFLGQLAPSLRSISFAGVCPTFQFPFLLPNLAEFHLRLDGNTALLRTSTFFQLFHCCPQLQKVRINVPGEMLPDVVQDQIISLESLLELDYICNSASRLLPFLRLPRLKTLRVLSLRPGKAQELADTLPYDGRDLLAGTTKMSYCPDRYPPRLDLSGNEVDVSLRTFPVAGHTTSDWFSDDSWIPFGQIEDLELAGSAAANLPVDIFAFENLRVIRIVLWGTEFPEGFLRLLHPDSNMGTPCRSLREIACTIRSASGSPLWPFIGMVKERKRAGHQLGVVCFITRRGCELEHVKELGLHVGELRFEELD